MQKSNDSKIQRYINQCNTPLEEIEGVIYKTEMFRPKFRGINPLVLENGSMLRLTDVDIMFCNYYEIVKEWCNRGFEVEIPI
jgi:hypothetical protein